MKNTIILRLFTSVLNVLIRFILECYGSTAEPVMLFVIMVMRLLPGGWTQGSYLSK